MSKEKTNTAPPAPEEPGTSDVIEIEWEQVSEIYETRATLIQTEQYLSSILLQHEKRKAQVLEEVMRLESNLYARASSLREGMSLDQSLAYELKLPQREGEKAYFLRKED